MNKFYSIINTIKILLLLMFMNSYHSMSTLKSCANISKNIIFLRHGTTEMNELMDPWGSPGFTDKLLYDTKLSSYGVIQCNTLNKQIKLKQKLKEINSIDLIVSSPLKRALQTADMVLKDIPLPNVSRLAHPLLRERLYLSSDVGKLKEQLTKEHPDWDYSHLPDDHWWYKPNNLSEYIEWRPSGAYAVPGEPYDIFKQRMNDLFQWLGSRNENNILVIAHWGVIKALTGKDFSNCQIESIPYIKLLHEPFVDVE